MVRMTFASRLFPLPLAAAATLWLAACQVSGTDQPVASLERPKPVGSEFASNEQAGADVQGSLPVETEGDAQSSGDPTAGTSDISAGVPTTVNAGGTTDDEGAAPNGASSSVSSGEEVLTSVVLGTTPGSERLTVHPRNNPTAADLLDHWGHRRTQGIVEGLALGTPASDADAADLTSLQAAVQNRSQEEVAPDLQDGDEVHILGARQGVTYGRWTGGPADTLSIEFDLSIRDATLRERPEIRAILEPILERAGKAWSYRIADTWATWELEEGDLKFWLIDGAASHTPVYVGVGGEVSTGLVIDVRDDDLPVYAAGWANLATSPPRESWQPRFGPLEIDTDHLLENLREDRTAALFGTLTHEIGHVLGSWTGGEETKKYADYTDTEAGTWTGPNVVALHGGPAPFQDASNAYAWIEGERDPSAARYDFAHSGVCASLMAYCGHSAALTPFLPHAIDFAFLADLGLTVTEETERPETYGLAGWTDYAGFAVAVSRGLQIDLADPQPHYHSGGGGWYALEVTDLLQAEVDAFGYRTNRWLGLSYPLVSSLGEVHYAGGLIGAAIDYDWMPPVTGDANLAFDLDTLDGAASFTSLAVHSDGDAETFAGGALHYPFALSDNAIIGTDDYSTLSANFYGPGHEEVAGTLLDPRAGLLASFGATHDDRPDREEVIGSATYLTGRTYQRGASDADGDGWTDYWCLAGSPCETNAFRSGSWSGWTATTRDTVIAATAGWDGRDTARLEADRDFARIERQTAASTDGRQGRHVVDGYTGTMEYGAFGVGFEKYSDGWTDSVGTPGGLFRRWNGAQGTMSRDLPDVRVQWSGLMLGYQGQHDALDDPFVEGVATIDFHLAPNRVDVRFSDIASRDGQRTLSDIAFRGLQPRDTGTVWSSLENGWLKGAFLGPDHEEVAGVFYHNTASVAGSFGAQRMSDIVTIEEAGYVQVAYTYTDDTGTHPVYEYEDWGIWGRQFQENLFGAFIEQVVTRAGNTFFYHTPTTELRGTASGSNPVSGNAVWLGGVRAFDTSHNGYLPVSGSARLEIDFSDATIDVDFTDFDTVHDDISWEALQVTGGSFRAFHDRQYLPTIEGAFYGAEHQGVAGEFNRDNLSGVFGAVRN